MIPKVIHYCWFGRGEKSKLIQKCMKSWKKYCPDYEIIEWNEDNFDINSNEFVRQAYECKKWAFVSDYVRLFVLYNYGGVYLDTDQELLSSLESFMGYEGFMGFLDDKNISAGIIGCKAKLSVVKEFLNYYSQASFSTTPNTNIMTKIMIENGLKMNDERQRVAEFEIFPQTVFCPTSCVSYKKKHSKQTVAVHHWAMTWRKPTEIKKFKKAKRHKAWWYYKNLMILPQKTVRLILGDDRVEKIKSKILNKGIADKK